MNQLLNEAQVSLERPYEKCMAFGAASLTDAELLAIIIRTGRRGRSAEDLAKEILRLPADGSGLSGLCSLTAAELREVRGIGEVKAVQLLCIGELSRRIAAYRAEKSMSFEDPGSIAEYYMEQLRRDTQENVILLLLDTKNQFLGEELVSRGTVNASLISTRDLFLTAMRFRAVSVILVHNHPSGDPTPSDADLRVTEKVAQAGELLDIHLLDHIIIGDCRYMSFADSGLLKPGRVYVH
ncbi:MAG: DNA repair protein RadC [Lachnospiraceae bacterium]|nr:DNA repair protein RadC [Lachnospiraceae bacterium]